MAKKIRTANRDLMKEWNTKLVLNLIREGAAVSQVEIIRKSGLSAGTVVNITRELRKNGFIKSTGYGESCGGRRPEKLRFNEKAKYVIGSALFPEETWIAMLDMSGKIKKKISYPTHPERGPRTVLADFVKRLRTFFSECRIPKEKVVALCVGIAGIVDADYGSLLFSTHLGWRNVPVKEMLEKATSLKVFVESEGRSMALGEYWFGAAKNANNVVCVDINEGIGVAVITNDRIYHGAHQMEGEIGHSSFSVDGTLCSCGKTGCLEAVASGSAILKRMRELFPNREVAGSQKENDLSVRKGLRKIFSAADKGNRSACRIIQEAGNNLGIAVAGVVNYADPEMVVLTGSVSEEDTGLYLKSVRKAFREKAFDAGFRKVEIMKGKLGEDAVLIGSATLAYQDLFTLSH